MKFSELYLAWAKHLGRSTFTMVGRERDDLGSQSCEGHGRSVECGQRRRTVLGGIVQPRGRSAVLYGGRIIADMNLS